MYFQLFWISLFIILSISRAVPSVVFVSTFPEKPSQTTRSYLPVKRSRLSILPTKLMLGSFSKSG